MRDVLAEICQTKRQHIAARRVAMPEAQLRDLLAQQGSVRGFFSALQAQEARRMTALIAEIKKASPSRGVIRSHFDPVHIARAYEAAGATCLSVLTDAPYFQGDDAYLAQVRAVTSLPLLRKDFILDPYQVLETRALGADAMLLIMAAVDDTLARELCDAARDVGLDVLVEVHDEEELLRALALSVPLIGVNHRSLKTLEIDLSLSARMKPKIPPHYVVVAESGIHHHADLLRLREVGIYVFLVGESLMKQENIEAAVSRLLHGDGE